MILFLFSVFRFSLQTPADDNNIGSEKSHSRLINAKEALNVNTTAAAANAAAAAAAAAATAAPMNKVNSMNTFNQMTPMHPESPPLQQIPYSSPQQIPPQNVVSRVTVASPVHNSLQQTIVNQVSRSFCTSILLDIGYFILDISGQPYCKVVLKCFLMNMLLKNQYFNGQSSEY